MDVNLENNKILTIPALALILALAICHFGANVILTTAALADATDHSRPYSVLGYSEKTPPCGTFGDVTNDGKISTEDVTFLYDNMEGFELDYRGDVNGNGTLDFDDVTILNNYLQGTIQTFPVCSITKQSPCGTFGDVNNDGKVSFADATYLYDNMNGFELDYRGDVNGNGGIDFNDVVMINSFVEGTIQTFTVCGITKQSPCGNYGDVDSDGKVSFADATYLYDNMSKLASNSMGDVNGNGVLDFDDVVLINSYMEGTIQTFPVCSIPKEDKNPKVNVKPKYSNGTLIRTLEDSKVYVMEEGERVWVKTSEEFQSSGYEWKNVKTISAQEMKGIVERVREAKLIMKDRKVYRLENGKLIWVPTVAAFNAQGLKWEEVGGSDANTETYEESRLIKDSRGNIYYIASNGKKKLVPNMDVFRSYGNKAEDVVEVSDKVIASMENVSLMRSKDDIKVYKIENRQKRWIKTLRSFQELGLKWEDIDIVNENEIAAYPEGSSIE